MSRRIARAISTFDNQRLRLSTPRPKASPEPERCSIASSMAATSRSRTRRACATAPCRRPARRFPTRAFPTTDYMLAGIFIQDEITAFNGRLSLYPAFASTPTSLDPEADSYPHDRAGRPRRHPSVAEDRRAVPRNPDGQRVRQLRRGLQGAGALAGEQRLHQFHRELYVAPESRSEAGNQQHGRRRRALRRRTVAVRRDRISPAGTTISSSRFSSAEASRRPIPGIFQYQSTSAASRFPASSSRARCQLRIRGRRRSWRCPTPTARHEADGVERSRSTASSR